MEKLNVKPVFVILFVLICAGMLNPCLALARRIKSAGQETKQAVMLSPWESRRLGEEVAVRLGINKEDITRTTFIRKEWQDYTDKSGEQYSRWVELGYDEPNAELEFDSDYRYLRLGSLIFINYEAEGTSLEVIREQLGGDFLRQYGGNIIFYVNPTPWQPIVFSESFHDPLPFIDRTTLVIVAYMLKQGVEGKIIADIGSGNGILSTVALRLGAKQVFALDGEQECLDKAEYVASINGYVPGKDIVMINHYIRGSDGISLGLAKDVTDKVELVISNTGPKYRDIPLQIIRAAGAWPSCRGLVLTCYGYYPVVHHLVVSEYLSLMAEKGFTEASTTTLGFDFWVEKDVNNPNFISADLLYGKKP